MSVRLQNLSTTTFCHVLRGCGSAERWEIKNRKSLFVIVAHLHTWNVREWPMPKPIDGTRTRQMYIACSSNNSDSTEGYLIWPSHCDLCIWIANERAWRVDRTSVTCVTLIQKPTACNDSCLEQPLIGGFTWLPHSLTSTPSALHPLRCDPVRHVVVYNVSFSYLMLHPPLKCCSDWHSSWNVNEYFFYRCTEFMGYLKNASLYPANLIWSYLARLKKPVYGSQQDQSDYITIDHIWIYAYGFLIANGLCSLHRGILRRNSLFSLREDIAMSSSWRCCNGRNDEKVQKWTSSAS